jgi:hypothetical protein
MRYRDFPAAGRLFIVLAIVGVLAGACGRTGPDDRVAIGGTARSYHGIDMLVDDSDLVFEGTVTGRVATFDDRGGLEADLGAATASATPMELLEIRAARSADANASIIVAQVDSERAGIEHTEWLLRDGDSVVLYLSDVSSAPDIPRVVRERYGRVYAVLGGGAGVLDVNADGITATARTTDLIGVVAPQRGAAEYDEVRIEPVTLDLAVVREASGPS